jgi:hypothetical protein
MLCLLLLLLLQSEERRNRALQPYRVTTPSRGIIGNSKYADRLRRQVRGRGGDMRRVACSTALAQGYVLVSLLLASRVISQRGAVLLQEV